MRIARNGWICALTVLALAACSRGDGQSGFSLDASSVTPDEFSVLPAAPLQMPAERNSLPAPEPGARDLVEIDYRARMLEALGARKGASGPPPADEAALIAALNQRGLGDPSVTGDLPIDPWAEWERLRALGVVVPPLPPR